MSPAAQHLTDRHPLPWSLTLEPVSLAERVARGSEIHERIKTMDAAAAEAGHDLPAFDSNMTDDELLDFHVDMESEAVYVLRDANGARVVEPADTIRSAMLSAWVATGGRHNPPDFNDRVEAVVSRAGAFMVTGPMVAGLSAHYMASLRRAVTRLEEWITGFHADLDRRADEEGANG